MKKTSFSFNSLPTKALLYLEKLYRKNKINFSVVYSLGLFTAAWRIFSALPDHHKPYYTDLIVLIPLTISILHFAFYLLYRKVGRKIISYSGLGHHKVRYTFDRLTNGGVRASDVEGDVFFKSLDFSDYLKEKYDFPETLLERRIAGEINYLAFSDTIWSGKDPNSHGQAELDALNKKIRRNAQHILRNKNTILLVKNSRGDFVGFTHVIPVSAMVWEKYLRGEIADLSFTEYNVCSDQEKAYGLIIFSIGKVFKHGFDGYLPSKISEHLSSEVNISIENEKKRRQQEKRKDLDVDLSAIYKGVFFHINTLINKNFVHPKIVPVLVQIEDPDLRETFENNNFIKHKIPSKDGYDIYTAHLIIDKTPALIE